MLSLNETLRPYLTKQTTFLAAFWTFVVMIAVALVCMIVVFSFVEYVPSIEGSPLWQPLLETSMTFSIIGIFSFLLSWAVLFALIVCRTVLRPVRIDGFLPTTACGAILGFALCALLVALTKNDGLSEFISPSLKTHFAVWGAVYGGAYFVFLTWLLNRTAKGKLHALG